MMATNRGGVLLMIFMIVLHQSHNLGCSSVARDLGIMHTQQSSRAIRESERKSQPAQAMWLEGKHIGV